MKLYKTCREIPIHNFFELSRTVDLRYLCKDYHADVAESEEIKQAYIDITDEYNSLFRGKQNAGMQQQAEKIKLQIQLFNLSILSLRYSESGATEHVLKMAALMNIDLSEIEVYQKTLRSQLNKIENKEKSNPAEKDEDSLEKTLTLVKENGFNFDRFTTPVIEFVFAVNRLEEKSEYYKSLAKK